ncbi:hypothetical protein [Botrimarina sp.]|uniref:hypothetical protein n=1 Tax=Botrimarina sp. TaxID=2795802 RepID=UPI0032EC1A26
MPPRLPALARGGLSLVVSLCAVSGFAQETFTYVGPSGQSTWETPANWSGGSGVFSGWPGESPEAGTLDSADLTGPRSGALELTISAPQVALDTLTLGSTAGFVETVVAGAEGSLLSVDEIHPRGGVFAINRVAIDLLLERDLDVRNALNALTIDGRIINSGSTSRRDVVNGTDRTLSLNGDILLSDTPGLPGTVRFRNEGPADTTVSGSIGDGQAAGGGVVYARGLFDLRGENTYTGRTVLGDNDPNVNTTLVIHTDTPFGSGRLVIGGGNALKTIRPAFGKGTRTLVNDIEIAREVRFDGEQTIVLNGDVWQSNGRRLTNDLAGDSRLVINGDVFAADSNDVREWVFDGLGLTVVNGVIDDSLANPLLTGASVAKRGAGTTVFTNPAVAAYSGPTRVLEGVLQLGDGGAPVDLNDDTVSGDGELRINHSGVLAFSAAWTDGLTVRHAGPGVTRLSRVSDGSGPVLVEAGELVANAGGGGGSATGAGDVVVSGGRLSGDGAIAGRVRVDDGGRISPGDGLGSLAIGAFDLNSGATLAVEIAGPAADHDSLVVAADAQLAGDLEVSLLGFTPDRRTQFEILSAGAIAGSFANAAPATRLSTTDGGGTFFVDYGPSGGVVLSGYTATTLPGDYNGDGAVDAADYVVWRDNLGAPAGALGNDPNAGPIGQAQYDTWAGAYGDSLAQASAVPEPSGAPLLAAAAAGVSAGAVSRRRTLAALRASRTRATRCGTP